MVCGPTASGKSAAADEFSEALSTFAILVDSMQVYREIPVITNQARGRPAKLSGVVSVAEEWSVAQHRAAVRREAESSGGSLVLDAGTGMYLNASILDIPLAPAAPEAAREAARLASAGEANPRRASRAMELEMSGGDGRGSIWGGELLYDAEILYMRPGMAFLEDSIRRRSRRIAASGMEEAEAIAAMAASGVRVGDSVLDAIGVRELLSAAHGGLGLPEAEERMNIRTRRLAKRQIRWFDKLARSLEGRARVTVLDPSRPGEAAKRLNTMHGIIGPWSP